MLPRVEKHSVIYQSAVNRSILFDPKPDVHAPLTTVNEKQSNGAVPHNGANKTTKKNGTGTVENGFHLPLHSEIKPETDAESMDHESKLVMVAAKKDRENNNSIALQNGLTNGHLKNGLTARQRRQAKISSSASRQLPNVHLQINKPSGIDDEPGLSKHASETLIPNENTEENGNRKTVKSPDHAPATDAGNNNNGKCDDSQNSKSRVKKQSEERPQTTISSEEKSSNKAARSDNLQQTIDIRNQTHKEGANVKQGSRFESRSPGGDKPKTGPPMAAKSNKPNSGKYKHLLHRNANAQRPTKSQHKLTERAETGEMLSQHETSPMDLATKKTSLQNDTTKNLQSTDAEVTRAEIHSTFSGDNVKTISTSADIAKSREDVENGTFSGENVKPMSTTVHSSNSPEKTDSNRDYAPNRSEHHDDLASREDTRKKSDDQDEEDKQVAPSESKHQGAIEESTRQHWDPITGGKDETSTEDKHTEVSSVADKHDAKTVPEKAADEMTSKGSDSEKSLDREEQSKAETSSTPKDVEDSEVVSRERNVFGTPSAEGNKDNTEEKTDEDKGKGVGKGSRSKNHVHFSQSVDVRTMEDPEPSTSYAHRDSPYRPFMPEDPAPTQKKEQPVLKEEAMSRKHMLLAKRRGEDPDAVCTQTVQEAEEPEFDVADALDLRVMALDRVMRRTFKEESLAQYVQERPRTLRFKPELKKRLQVKQEILVLQELLVRLQEARERRARWREEEAKRLEEERQNAEQQKEASEGDDDQNTPKEKKVKPFHFNPESRYMKEYQAITEKGAELRRKRLEEEEAKKSNQRRVFVSQHWNAEASKSIQSQSGDTSKSEDGDPSSSTTPFTQLSGGCSGAGRTDNTEADHSENEDDSRDQNPSQGDTSDENVDNTEDSEAQKSADSTNGNVSPKTKRKLPAVSTESKGSPNTRRRKRKHNSHAPKFNQLSSIAPSTQMSGGRHGTKWVKDGAVKQGQNDTKRSAATSDCDRKPFLPPVNKNVCLVGSANSPRRTASKQQKTTSRISKMSKNSASRVQTVGQSTANTTSPRSKSGRNSSRRSVDGEETNDRHDVYSDVSPGSPSLPRGQRRSTSAPEAAMSQHKTLTSPTINKSRLRKQNRFSTREKPGTMSFSFQNVFGREGLDSEESLNQLEREVTFALSVLMEERIRDVQNIYGSPWLQNMCRRLRSRTERMLADIHRDSRSRQSGRSWRTSSVDFDTYI